MKGGQALGQHEFRYWIYPHAGDWDTGRVPRQADALGIPLEPAQAGPHAGDLPKTASFLALTPAELMLSSIKRAEDGAALVVRVYNPTRRAVTGQLTLFRAPQGARYLSLNEQPLPGAGPELVPDGLRFAAGAKKIVTLELSFPEHTNETDRSN
jgi:alpha-mannosidase